MDEEFQNDDLAAFFEAGKASDDAKVPNDLTARVLADAASIGMAYQVPEKPAKRPFFKGFFAPIGGFRGAFALGSCACFGFIVGISDAETLYALPVMGDILANFTGDLDGLTTFDSLNNLMAES